MALLPVLKSLGAAQVCMRLLPLCMRVQEKWNSAAEGVVILDNGTLLATEAAWQRYPQMLCNLANEGKLVYPSLQWALADSAFVRQCLADGDASRRELARRAALALDAETLAKQSLLDIVSDAYSQGASDIHFRMTGSEARIAYRIHGQLRHQTARSRTSVTEAIAAALNTQSDDFHDVFDESQVTGASITLTLPDSGLPIRIRSQKSPCRDGFSVTLRLQADSTARALTLSELGFASERAKRLQHIMGQATGLLLISGPTGHGKTTTLAALNREVPATRKVVSLEDPIEIIQPRIEQKYVSTDNNPEAFAHMIRSVLREDPDVIEVSEIRDLATAKAAVTAATTGHLVVSTVHATDAVGILSRLYDLGVSSLQLSQPHLFAGLLAQRLLPKLCSSCKERVQDNRWGTVYRQSKSGCEQCNFTGSNGRIAISELIVPNEEATTFIREQKLSQWCASLAQQGWDSMACEAFMWVQRGVLDPSYAAELIPGYAQHAGAELQQEPAHV